MKSHVVMYKGVKETHFRILGANHCGEMVIVRIRFLQSPSIQRHLFFGRATHLHRFAISIVDFSVAQLDLQHPDHLAIYADEAMLTLDLSSIF